MTTANTNYNATLMQIEQLKLSINEVEESIKNQIPLGITNQFDKAKSGFMNWIKEIEITLNQFNNAENE